MAKKTVTLTEEQFRNAIAHAVNAATRETPVTEQLVPQRAEQRLSQDNRTNKPAIDLSSLTQTIQSKFPDLMLEFVEHNDATNRSYPVDMEYSSVKYIDKDRVVFDGKLQVAGNPFETGTIEYNFNTGEFNRVYYSEKTTLCRRMNRHWHMIVHNSEIVNPLIAFLSTYMDGEKKSIFIPFLYRPFNFYGEDLLGTVTLVVFTMTGMSIVGLEQVKLNGMIDVNNERIKAKGILWNLRKDKVYYQQSGHKYYLEIDNRNIELWKELSATIYKVMKKPSV